jgi:uncharacterized protein HemX
MSATYPDMGKDLHNGEMNEESTQASSALEEEKKATKSDGEEGEAESEYAEGLALFLIVLGLGLGIFLGALDMVRCIGSPTSKLLL